MNSTETLQFQEKDLKVHFNSRKKKRRMIKKNLDEQSETLRKKK